MGRLLQFSRDFEELLKVPFSSYSAKYTFQTGHILQQLVAGTLRAEPGHLHVFGTEGNQYVHLRTSNVSGAHERKTIIVTPGSCNYARGESDIGIKKEVLTWTVKHGELTPRMVSDAYLAIKASIAGFANCQKLMGKKMRNDCRSELEQALTTGELGYVRATEVARCLALAQNP